ncbi:hypothetical protein HDU85_004914 [Gaertneriomyces sp. JEL0708]|nr:hypothetical protein HDU85_004914 [Gaertneriomyces sp. JEL0708]
MNNSTIALSAAAVGITTAAVAFLVPSTIQHEFPITKRELKIPPPPQIEPVAPLSASWSFVDQSTSVHLQEAATRIRAIDHAEKIFGELLDPEAYYVNIRQTEFGVEVLDCSSGITRYIRKRKARQAQGPRVGVTRRFGEKDEAGRGKVYSIEDTLGIFNTTVVVKHRIWVEHHDAEGMEPTVVCEVNVATRGPVMTAWLIGRHYADRLKDVGNVLESKWSGKEVQRTFH